MDKLLIVFFLAFALYACQFHHTELYEQQDVIYADTLDIEQIKIPTH